MRKLQWGADRLQIQRTSPVPTPGLERIDVMDATTALRWVKRLHTIEANRTTLRELLATEWSPTTVQMLNDDVLLQSIARLLHTRRWTLTRWTAPDAHGGAGDDAPAQAAPEIPFDAEAPAPIATPQRTSVFDDVADPVANPTPTAANAPQIDIAAQAAVLKQAARSAAAFCEECAKQKPAAPTSNSGRSQAASGT